MYTYLYIIDYIIIYIVQETLFIKKKLIHTQMLN